MQILKHFDKANYDPTWHRFSREAVRAIILRGEKIALIYSTREGYYKFPGGGMEDGESHEDTLIRETKEETGLSVIPSSIREFGETYEIRKSLFEGDEIFEQRSYYYTASVDDTLSEQMLDGYEAEEGYVLEWVDIRTAYEINKKLGDRGNSDFLLREAFILEMLLSRTV